MILSEGHHARNWRAARRREVDDSENDMKGKVRCAFLFSTDRARWTRSL